MPDFPRGAAASGTPFLFSASEKQSADGGFILVSGRIKYMKKRFAFIFWCDTCPKGDTSRVAGYVLRKQGQNFTEQNNNKRPV